MFASRVDGEAKLWIQVSDCIKYGLASVCLYYVYCNNWIKSQLVWMSANRHGFFDKRSNSNGGFNESEAENEYTF